jgi:hypothetical protein
MEGISSGINNNNNNNNHNNSKATISGERDRRKGRMSGVGGNNSQVGWLHPQSLLSIAPPFCDPKPTNRKPISSS